MAGQATKNYTNALTPSGNDRLFEAPSFKSWAIEIKNYKSWLKIPAIVVERTASLCLSHPFSAARRVEKLVKYLIGHLACQKTSWKQHVGVENIPLLLGRTAENPHKSHSNGAQMWDEYSV